MKSWVTVTPSAQVKVVSRTFVSGRYRRAASNGTVGATCQVPAYGSISRRSSGGLSKRGQQSQSIRPHRSIRAAVRMSPIRP